MIPVKICGITSCYDAEMAIKFNASAIGLIFYKPSQRYVDPKLIFEWVQELPVGVKKVGVFVNEKVEVVKSIADMLNLDFIQLHGDEGPAYCDEISYPIIKTFSVDNYVDISMIARYKVYAYLFDTYHEGIKGGTGKSFDWNLISKLNIDNPVILSGGLNIDNIKKGIQQVKPDAVDINSGVEFSPGKKDEIKMKNIFNKLREVPATSSIFNS